MPITSHIMDAWIVTDMSMLIFTLMDHRRNYAAISSYTCRYLKFKCLLRTAIYLSKCQRKCTCMLCPLINVHHLDSLMNWYKYLLLIKLVLIYNL
jgi:hypothetical protein